MNPTIFISSSYFNLKTGRNEISKFCENMGYDSMLSEKIDIAHASDLLLDESCCNSVQLHADMLVLIIGGRYNLPTSEFRDKVKLKEFHERYESITLKEYKCAQEKQIPIYIFINRDVMTEYKTYSKQKELNFVTKDTPYAIVESVNVFLFIDKILSQTINNQYQLFNNYTDIENWLRVQWAETFKEFLTSKRDKRISKEDEKLYNYKTYDNSDEAFSDLYKKINLEAENKSKIGNSPFEFNLKGISFAMLHSKTFLFTKMPMLIEKYPQLQLRIETVMVDPRFFSKLALQDYGVDWLKQSEQRISEVKRFNDECSKKFDSRLSIEYKHYSNIPHWHGWLLNDEYLFLGRTNWNRNSNDEPLLQVGQNKYRFFDLRNDSGQERIQLFKAWFEFYTEMNERIYG